MFNIIVVGDVEKPQEALRTLHTIAADKNGRRSVSLLNISASVIDKKISEYAPIFEDKVLALKHISDTPNFMATYEALRQLRKYIDDHPVTMVEPEEGDGIPALVNAAIDADDSDAAFIIEGGTMFSTPWYREFYDTIMQAKSRQPIGAFTGRLVNLSLGKVICAGMHAEGTNAPTYVGYDDYESVVRYNARVRLRYVPKEFMIVSKALWKDLGGFDERYKVAFWDFDFSDKLVANSQVLFYEPRLRLSTYNSMINSVAKAVAAETIPEGMVPYMAAFRKDADLYMSVQNGGSDG